MKKIFIFLPDGVGLKNFAHTKFYDEGKQLGNEVVFWNNTKFPLKNEFGYKEVKVPHNKSHFLSDLYKRAKIIIELRLNYKKTKNQSFLNYIRKGSNKGLKNRLKTIYVDILVKTNLSIKGLQKVLNKIYALERKSAYYDACKKQLIVERPDFILCTSQRSLLAIAPMLAANDLNIPTACFIFSWDNLPKATLLVEADYYFVWSNFMKEEMLFYAPHIKKEQIRVTGTPQFEPHQYHETYLSKEDFYTTHKLDKERHYVCFSGDDITTSPNDQYYLEDLVESISQLNQQGYNLGIIFRKCPVDFSKRYDFVIEKYPDIVKVISPKWSQKGEGWNAIMPLKEDLALLTNTCKHSFLILNIGSSMIFDGVNHNTLCAYFNYNTQKRTTDKWHIEKIYKYIHFQSMPNKGAVLWINDKSQIKDVLLKALQDRCDLKSAKEWYNIINQEPQNEASNRMWHAIKNIL